MPLKSGKSRAAFSSNVKAEMEAGRPRQQALAIAYAKKAEKRVPPKSERKISSAKGRPRSY